LRLQRLWTWAIPLQIFVIMGTAGLMFGVVLSLVIVLLRGDITPAYTPTEIAVQETAAVVAKRQNSISRVFTPEVQYWSDYIMKWSREYGVDADILATVMQIESCGQYLVSSPAGAQGLFQVMPFHFEDGEDPLDVDTNAKRGINYLREGLELADGHIGLAMAGYNGGHGVIGWGWARWSQETRNYYYWGSGIYRDAVLNKRPEESEALQSWLNAGGIRLCRQADMVLSTRTPGLLTPTPYATVGTPIVFPSPTPWQQPTFPPPTNASDQPADGLQPPTVTPTLYIPPLPATATPIAPPPTITPGPSPTVFIPPARTAAPTIVIPPTITPAKR